MPTLKTLATATLALVISSSAFAVEQPAIQTTNEQTLPRMSTAEGEFRLSQTATCLLDGKRYNKGARMCIGGVYNYCNSKGLWEPSNLTC